MHVQIVTYRVEGVSDAEFIEANREFADAMAAVPGLLAKVWLKQPDVEVYGGLYCWRDREAYEAFLASELWGEVLNERRLDARRGFRRLRRHGGTHPATQPELELL